MPKKITLNGPVIGDGSAWLYDWFGIPYISASKVSRELTDARGDEVELYINSGGGSVFAGSEVYTLLKEYRGKVTAKITGIAASAASFLAMAADEIMMSPPSQMMIHNAATWTDGDKNSHMSSTNMLHSADHGITNAYRLRTGKSQDELLALMDKTTWMNAQQAVELGFADGILFDDSNTLIAVSNSISGEIPPQVEERLRDALINAALKGQAVPDAANLFKGMDLSALIPQAGVVNALSTVEEEESVVDTGDGEQDDQTKEAEKPMNEEDLKNQHPELYAKIISNGAEQERARINALNEMASAPGAAEIVAKAIAEGGTAAQAAMDIVKASKERLNVEGAHRQADSQSSGVHQVNAVEAPIDESGASAAKNENEQRAAKAARIAAYANQKLKGAGQ